MSLLLQTVAVTLVSPLVFLLHVFNDAHGVQHAFSAQQ